MTIAALRAQIAEVEAAILRQYQLIKELEGHLQNLNDELNSIPYPVLTLPPEITSEIFIHCLPWEWDSTEYAIEKWQAPLLLAQICRSWRQITLSTPALWTSLSVNVSRPQVPEMLETWASRARACPLSVQIWTFDLIKLGADPKAWLDSFRRYSDKMQRLHLHECAEELAQLEALGPAHKFTSLEELIIELPEGEADIQNLTVSMFNHIPLLHKVKLVHIPLARVQLPWEQLSEFQGHGYLTLVECVEALSLLPNITRCELEVYYDGDDEIPSHPFVHSKIQTLRINETARSFVEGNDELPHLLQFLTLPALHVLRLGKSDDLSGQILDAFLLRSSPPLKSLTFDATVPQKFPSMPSTYNLRITDLEIDYPTRAFTFTFFNTFASNVEFLPRMRNLSFCCRETGGDDGTDPAGLSYFIGRASRAISKRMKMLSEGCSGLRSLRIMSDGRFHTVFNFSNYQLDPYRKLKERGMDIYIMARGQVILS